jgi:signal transduction histidine kinase
MQSRFPHSEALQQWRPEIPGRKLSIGLAGRKGSIDFHELLRSVEDTYDLSSLTRMLYLASLFSVPLSEQAWCSLFLCMSDRQYFYSLVVAGVIESVNGGFRITGDSAKQHMVKKFLFDSYPLAKQHVTQQQAQRNREARERKVRYTELDRKALETIPDGIICVDASRSFFYINPAAEKILDRNREVKEHLFGNGQLDDALKRYSVETVLQAVRRADTNGDQDAEIFGNRLIIPNGGKRFEVELSPHVIQLRDITDQHLIHQEVGKLYRHEARAALDVMGVGLDTAKQLIGKGQIDQALKCLEQVDDKRTELFSLLEDRIDFIRIHSDAFRIHPSPVKINLLVEKCVSTYTDAASSKQVTIESNHLQAPDTVLNGEERFLLRALDNIIRNAIKFAPNGSTITVKIGRKQNEAFVSITDRGPGIPQSNLERIFDLGFTTNGSGRGLYLSQRIVAAHEGKIEVVSKLSRGTCFTVRLPLLKES